MILASPARRRYARLALVRGTSFREEAVLERVLRGSVSGASGCELPGTAG